MNKGLKIGAVFLVIMLLLTTFLEINKKEKIDWSDNFKLDSKSPFGLYILNHEIKNWTNYQGEINETLYQKTSKLDHQKSAIFIVGNGLNYELLTETAQEETLDFVAKGGTLFVSSYLLGDLPQKLDLDYIAISSYDTYIPLQINYYENWLIKGNQHFKIEQKNKEYTVDQTYVYFNKKKKNDLEILGYVRYDKDKYIPNFIRVKHGKGFIYLHSYPKAFTNYYLLKEPSYLYARESLSYLKGKEVYWFSPDKLQESNHILRFILTNKTLAFAWRLLFAALILYFVFRSKREQSAIPIIKPEANLTVEFTKTIASMYYENNMNANIAQKKIDYFFFNIRKHFGLDTNNLLQPKNIKTLAHKANMSQQETEKFIEQLLYYKQVETLTTEELHTVNELVENYKKKAHIL